MSFIDRPASQATTTTATTTTYVQRHYPNLTEQKQCTSKTIEQKTNSNDLNKTETQNAVTSDKLRGDKLEKAAEEAKEDADKVSPPNCCECFPSPQKKWSDKSSAQMSDIYSPETDKPDFSSPACLATVSKSPVLLHRHLLTIESEIEFHGSNNNKKKTSKTSPRKDIKKSPKKQMKLKKSVNGKILERKLEMAEEAEDAVEVVNHNDNNDHSKSSPVNTKHTIRVNGKEEFPEEIQEVRELNVFVRNRSLESSRENIPLHVSKSGTRSKSNSLAEVHKISSPRSTPRRGIQRFFTYRGRKQSTSTTPSSSPVPPAVLVSEVEPSKIKISKVRSYETSFTQPRDCEFKAALDSSLQQNISSEELNGQRPVTVDRNYATFPRIKKSHFHPSILYSRETNRTPFKVPKRTTPDGTTIYYWCNVPKSKIKGDFILTLHNS